MALSSGTSSAGSDGRSSSGGTSSEVSPQAPPQAVIEHKRKRRMESNRESARRSRMRKQQHLDGLTAQVNHLRKENHQILTTLNMTTQNVLVVEAENSLLRTQMMELQSRLHALNDILCYMNNATTTSPTTSTSSNFISTGGGGTTDAFSTTSTTIATAQAQLMNPWSSMMHMNQPIDLYQCY